MDAGSDTLVTLPQNWVVLDGSKSVDDVGIQKWQWTQLQYTFLLFISFSECSSKFDYFNVEAQTERSLMAALSP